MIHPLVLGFVVALILVVGIATTSWAFVDVQYVGFSIKNCLLSLLGIAIIGLGMFGIKWGSEYSTKRELLIHPEKAYVEIKTTTPPKIDTIITIKNGVSDTVYVYRIKKYD